VTGYGIYRSGGEFQQVQQLELCLKRGDAESEHFDSGLVPGGQGFPSLVISVSENHFSCFDTRVSLEASPSPDATPVLERYSFSTGGSSDGFLARLTDQHLGGGTAQFALAFRGQSTASRLTLRVWRTVPPGTVTFALLVAGVRVTARDENGAAVYTRDLEGFSFGDSASGRWSRTVDDLPNTARQVSIVFFGNYE
jgi:hypothetical protein